MDKRSPLSGLVWTRSIEPFGGGQAYPSGEGKGLVFRRTSRVASAPLPENKEINSFVLETNKLASQGREHLGGELWVYTGAQAGIRF